MQIEAEVWREHMRLGVLRALDNIKGGIATVSMIHEILKRVGIHTSRDQLVGEGDWLQSAGMVMVTDRQGVVSVSITPRGREIAKGEDRYSGIAAPSER